jgi:hypothetical protein
LWSSVNILGTQRAHNFLYPNFSVTASWIVVLDTYGMMWCKYLIVMCRFARISPSVSWRSSSEIKDGLPLLCSSWTSVLPSGNSQHHFITFCRFMTLPQTAKIFFVNFRWTFNFWVKKSYDGTHLTFGGTLDRRWHFKHWRMVLYHSLRQIKTSDLFLVSISFLPHIEMPSLPTLTLSFTFTLHLDPIQFPCICISTFWSFSWQPTSPKALTRFQQSFKAFSCKCNQGIEGGELQILKLESCRH